MNFTADEDIKQSIRFLKLSFSDDKLPVFKELKGKDIISYGEKNDYPEKLIELYNRSPKHNAIVTKKARFITGKETVIESQPDKVVRWNKYDSVQEFKYKIELDKRLFGAFAVEVVYDRLGIPSYYHIPVSKIRTLDHEEYQYWPDGAKTKRDDIKYYQAYDPNNKTVDPDTGLYNKQILYYREYRADLGVYGLPDYIGAIQYIQIDTRIANFHLNNIKNGFTGGTLIQMFKGDTTPEEVRAIEKAFKKRYGGDDGDEAGGLILQFNNPNEQASVISPLAANDLDQRFLTLNNHVQQEIFVGHGITSPMLFGVRVEGQLGGRNELAEAYEIYYRDVIEPEQEFMDRFLESLLLDMGKPSKVQTTKLEPVNQDVVLLYEKGLVTKEYAQEALGVPVDEVPQLDETQKLNSAINSLSPLVANKVLNELSINEVCRFAGLPPIPGGDNVSQPTDAATQFSEQNPFGWDYEKALIEFAACGESESDYEDVSLNFADLTAKEIKVMSIINSNEKATVEEISKATKIETKEVQEILKKLDEAGKIKWGNTAIKITELGKKAAPDLGKIVLRYKYAVSPEARPLKTQSRDFCKKLMELGKVYSREDIDTMSARLGYDVWKMRGGWYHDPVKDVNLPHCRHEWKQVLMRKKK